ncbi:MAG TPA: DUF4214 domain-containing protein [Burkholderiaceae bacterium]
MKFSGKLAARLLSALLAAALASCGGSSQTGAKQSDAAAQARQLVPARKDAAAQYQNAVQQLYVAYFGRPADPAGLVNFENALSAANAPTDINGLNAAYSTNAAVKTLIDSFGISNESKTLYGSGTTTDFVTKVFQNVLGRAPQSAGLGFWTDAIDSGRTSPGDAALDIMAGALNNTTPQGLLDAQLVNNRLAAASFFTGQVSAYNAAGGYAGQSAAASARAMLAAVGSSTDSATWQAAASVSAAGLLGSGPVTELLAGNTGGAGGADGGPSVARFNGPQGVVADSKGNLFVADSANYAIRKIATDGTVSTFAGAVGVAGSSDGQGTAARFGDPVAIAIDNVDNLYVADQDNHTVRKITPTGLVSTLAGKPGVAGQTDGLGGTFWAPAGVAVDRAGVVFVTDSFMVRKVDSDGTITTIAGAETHGELDGQGTAARFYYLGGIAVDANDNLYVVDSMALTIRKITADGYVSTFAGTYGQSGSTDGQGSAARFARPVGIAIDSNGNLYVTEYDNDLVRMITPGGMVTRISGLLPIAQGSADGGLAQASYKYPQGIGIDRAGNLYVADTGNNLIRKLSAGSIVSTVAGLRSLGGQSDGTGSAANFTFASSMAHDAVGNLYLVNGASIVKLTPGGTATTFVGNAGTVGYADANGTAARFNGIGGLVFDASGNLYLTDSGNNVVRMVTPDGQVSTVAGNAGALAYVNGQGSAARFGVLGGIAIDSQGNLYVADSTGSAIRKIDTRFNVSTFAGGPGHYGTSDGNVFTASFDYPSTLAMDASGNLYVSDGNSTIRVITAAGSVRTVAGVPSTNVGFADGTGTAALFGGPANMTTDAAGNVYVADTNNDAVRLVTPAGVVTTIAGFPGRAGFSTGAGANYLDHPRGLTLWGGTLYVTSGNAVAGIYNMAAP